MSKRSDRKKEEEQAAASGDEAESGSEKTYLLLSVWLPESVLQRIRESGRFEITDDVDRASEAAIVAVFTRVPRGEMTTVIDEIGEATKSPVVAVCHAGGEDVAIDFMRRGCAGVVAEGNEIALMGFVDREAFSETLVDSYFDTAERSQSANQRDARDDTTAELPERSSFEMRLSGLEDSGISPRIIMTRVTNLEDARRRSDRLTINILRRRVSDALANAARNHGCEIFALDFSTFAIIDADAGVKHIDAFNHNLINITEAFSPVGTPLTLAIGHDGPRADADASAIRELAERALDAAAQSESSTVVNAEEVTLRLASSTELAVAEQLAAHVDNMLPYPDGHSGRVAELSSQIARDVGLQGRELIGMKLAALLHDVGQVTDAGTTHAEGEVSQGSDQDHAERGARYALPSAGQTVADAIRYQVERWDGSGPGGLAGEDIPPGARIIALADAFDAWVMPPAGVDPLDAEAAAERLEGASGEQFDPALVQTALRLLKQA